MSEQLDMFPGLGSGGLPAEVAFGSRPNQVLSAATASALLTLWCERAPATFGAYLAEVLTGHQPAATRSRK